MDGWGEVFSNGVDEARHDREADIHDLHAKIGQLMVGCNFLAGGLKRRAVRSARL